MKFHSVVASALLVFGIPSLSAALVPGDLCTGNPCVITQDFSTDASEVLNFGSTTELRFQTGVRVTFGDGGEAAITAGTIIIEPRVRFRSTAPGVSLDFQADNGDFTVGTPASGATFDFPGGVELSSYSFGSSFFNARVDLSGETDDEAGALSMQSDGDLTLLGTIKADGERTGEFNAGQIDLDAAGTLTVDAKIKARGRGEVDSGFIFLRGTDATIGGKIDVRGKPGLGGTLELDITNDLTMTVKTRAKGRNVSGAPGSACDGGIIDLQVGGNLFLEGPIDARGGGTECPGGTLSAQVGGDWTQTDKGRIRVGTGGFIAQGGDVDITVDGNATLDKIDAKGDLAGSISVTAAGTLNVANKINASSTGIADRIDGTVTLQGDCGLTVGQTGKVSVRKSGSSGGQVSLRTSGGPMTVDGKVEASDSNELRYVTGFDPVINGSVTPAPSLVESPTGTCGS